LEVSRNFIGVDVSKAQLDVAVVPLGERRGFSFFTPSLCQREMKRGFPAGKPRPEEPMIDGLLIYFLSA